MALLMTLRRTRAAVQRPMARLYGTSLPIPNVPEGTATVFHSRMQTPKYSLSNPKWFAIFFAMNLGVYFGHYFYLRFLMIQNPPNPPRDPANTGAPERHMHTVDDE
mmetsp:Transcript_21263/g.59415  ORF Transcript_21263/g.59415 Transcript_21263/m.59415 type:complete len:106 (-) Transcript_21263:125-442(-)